MHSDYSDLQEKLNQSREKFKRAALLMSEFLFDILEDRNNILTDQSSIHAQDMRHISLNLEKVRNTSLEDLDNEDKKQLVFLLLKQLQPYLSASNLSTNPHQFNPQNLSSQINSYKQKDGNLR